MVLSSWLHAGSQDSVCFLEFLLGVLESLSSFRSVSVEVTDGFLRGEMKDGYRNGLL